MSFRVRSAKRCPIHSTLCSSVAPSRTHRAELGTSTCSCSLILCGQSRYLNTPSNKYQHAAWAAASQGQRKLSIAENSIYAASFQGSYGPDLALYVHHPSFGNHSPRYHPAPPSPRPTHLNAAVSLFVGDTGFFHSEFAWVDLPDWRPSPWRWSASLSFQKCLPWLGPD